MKSVWIIAVFAVLSACGEARSPAPDSGEHGYLVFNPPTQEKGWALVDELTARAPARDRIRTSGLVREDGKTMFVDFSGNCKAQTALVDEARKIADRQGVVGMRCLATPPAG